MKSDGTLTKAELERTFGAPPAGQRFQSLDGINPDALLHIGDMVRIVAYNDPDFFDRLWNSAQTNAGEHTDQVVGAFTQNGVAVTVHQVQGQAIADEEIDHREVYVYDLEIVGFTDPPNYVQLGVVDFRGLALLVTSIAALIGVATVSGLVLKAEIAGPGKGAHMVSSGIFWLSLAAIAVSIAVIVKSAKAAVP
jgi:hypothetical protein